MPRQYDGFLRITDADVLGQLVRPIEKPEPSIEAIEAVQRDHEPVWMQKSLREGVCQDIC
jgi:hypothetical protein